MRFRERVVTLVCSQIWFKGYKQFILLASKMPDCTFLLILNGSELQFEHEYSSNNLPSNVTVKFNHKDMPAVMAASTVVLFSQIEGDGLKPSLLRSLKQWLLVAP